MLSTKDLVEHPIRATSVASKKISFTFCLKLANKPGNQTAQFKKQFGEVEMLRSRFRTISLGFANLPF